MSRRAPFGRCLGNLGRYVESQRRSARSVTNEPAPLSCHPLIPMTIHLPEDLESYVQSEVEKGRFASSDEAITEAVRLLREQKQEAEGRAAAPDKISRRMLEAGLLTHIPVRPDPPTCCEFLPIVIEGEPVSETIIRERR